MHKQSLMFPGNIRLFARVKVNAKKAGGLKGENKKVPTRQVEQDMCTDFRY